MKVLVTDKINESAGNIISSVADVDFLPTMSEDELVEKIGQYDALMVRSQTKVTPRIIEAAKNLKIIGKNYEWLKKEVKKFNINPEEALVVTIDGKGQIFCQKKEEQGA